ncbi:MAG: hypothetical protein ACR2PL_06160 [Dehalococcoidia bacterium]
MNLEQYGRVPVGEPVFSQDGEKLGEIKAVEGDYFQVAAAPDYWLASETVVAYEENRVIVSFDKQHLDIHKTELPGDAEPSSGRPDAKDA